VKAPGDASCKLISLEIYQDNRQLAGASALITRPIEIRITLSVEHAPRELGVSLFIYNCEAKLVVHTSSVMNRNLRCPVSGEQILSVQLPAYLLNAGSYSISLSADIPHNRIIFSEQNIVSFNVTADCPEMGRYGIDDWKGLVGPGICIWAKYG
jgi:hypothetical protein